ncbi:MAG: hypothetical protein HDT47_08425 [Ruminococcaceae bacterium]|nr:hypothetical protein [Oscillospiraceae bacterium]
MKSNGHTGILKRIVLSASGLIAALSLTACEGQSILTPKPPELNKLFEFSANITCDTGSFSALFSRTAIGSWEVTVTEPYELQGITFTYTKGNAGASLDGLTADMLTSEFSSSPVACIAEALENAVQDGLASVVYADNSYTVHSGGTVLSFPQGSNVPGGFEITDKQIKGEITEFNVTEEIFKDGADVVLVL